MKKLSLVLCGFVMAGLSTGLAGTMESEYLGNHQRTGFVDAQVPSKPVLLWSYQTPHAPRHAWKEPMREVQHIDFDYADHVAMDGERVYFGSSADHTVRALDQTNGQELWRFVTEGAVRFAPVVKDGRVYAVSDDGNLYCLESETGRLVWKFRGGPLNQKLIGNEQMVSRWPARSGVILEGDKLFFAAGMWSREGIFVYCLNAADGSVVWKNDTSGFWFSDMPHGDGFGGVAPQGPMLLHKDTLILPCGRALPAAFDARTGKLLWHENDYEKPHHPGSSWLVAADGYVICKRRVRHGESTVSREEFDPPGGANSGLMGLDYRTGVAKWALTDKDLAAMRGSMMVLAGWGEMIKADLKDIVARCERIGATKKADPDIPTRDGAGGRFASSPSKPPRVTAIPLKKWSADVGRVYTLLIAGDTVIAGGRGKVTLVDYNTGKILRTRSITGNARGICAIDGKFIVSSSDGTQYCFGAGKKDSGIIVKNEFTKPSINPAVRKTTQAIVKESGITEGYCLMLGAGDGQLLYDLVDQTKLTVFCVEPDKAKVSNVRKMLDQAGLLGVRAQVFNTPFDQILFNPYFANLILRGSLLGSGQLDRKAFADELRPCGGVSLQVAKNGSVKLLEKRGKLPNTADWTHPYANIGRTFASEDETVQLPLGMLWFGGVGPERIVSRHWRAPIPIIANGIMYIQGEHDLIAVDAYNGREMWDLNLPNVGRYPASSRGGNIVADDGHVYCIQGLECLQIDHAGKVVKKYTFPLSDGQRQAALAVFGGTKKKKKNKKKTIASVVWEYLGITDRYVIGTLGLDGIKGNTASKYIFAFDKQTGRLRWTHGLGQAVSPMAIVADEKRMILLDRTFEDTYQTMKKRGLKGFESRLVSLDLASGKALWTTPGMPPSAKALMLKNGVVVAGPNPEEVQADLYDPVFAYSAATGTQLWKNDMSMRNWNSDRRKYVLYQLIIGDTVYLPEAYDLQTGAPRKPVTDPLTDEAFDFGVYGINFCTTVSAAKNVLTYRSASVAFQEVDRYSGVYWYPEVRPSCWASVIFGGGLALAPEGSSTCTCPYNYKTSLALYPVKRQEAWGLYMDRYPNSNNAQGDRLGSSSQAGPKNPPVRNTDVPVKFLHVNLGALGDRMDAQDRLWLGYPKGDETSLKSFNLVEAPVRHEGETERFGYNADWRPISGTETPWLYTYGLTGAAKFDIRMAQEGKRTYSVTLHFAETSDVEPGQRVFDVLVQGKKVLPGFDILKEAGGKDTALVKTFAGIPSDGSISIELRPVHGEAPLLCAFEIIEEK